MNDKVNGLVLSINDYKENDSIIQTVTNEYGIISLVAKASKKIDSKNHFLTMCEYEFIIDYKDNKTIFSIKGHKLLNNYFEDKNIDLLSLKNVLIECALKNRDINTYDELIFVFRNINDSNKYLLASLFVSHLCKQYGVMPNVEGCALCGNKKVVSISNEHGGFLCQTHINGEKIINVDRLKKFRLIVKATKDNYDVIKDFVYDINDFYLIMNFYVINADLKIKAYDFYKELN